MASIAAAAASSNQYHRRRSHSRVNGSLSNRPDSANHSRRPTLGNISTPRPGYQDDEIDPDDQYQAPDDLDLRDFNARRGVVYQNVHVSIATLYYGQSQTLDHKKDGVMTALMNLKSAHEVEVDTEEARTREIMVAPPANGIEYGEFPKFVSGLDHLIIDPRSYEYSLWQRVLIAVLTFTAIVTPFEVGILRMDGNVVLFVINRFVDLFFLIDLLITFRLAFFTKYSAHVLEVRPKAIRDRYITGWFALDIAVIIPWEVFGNSLQVLKLLRLLRLGKLMNLNGFESALQQWQYALGVSNSTVNLASNVGMVVIGIHWTACLWYLMMMAEDKDEPLWLTSVEADWHYDNVSAFNGYPAAVYHSTMTVTTIGYGDVHAMNSHERGVSVFVMLIGSWMYAYIIAISTVIVASMNQEVFAFNELVDTLADLEEERELPPDLAVRTRDFLQYARAVEQNRIWFGLSSQMSPPLQAECNSSLMATIDRCRHLKSLGSGFKTQLIPYLVPEAFPPGELILRAGRVNSMVFIVQGTVQLYGQVQGPGAVFGEESISKQGIQLMPVYSTTYVKTLRLYRHSLHTVLDKFPRSTAGLRKAEVRLAFRRGIIKAIKLLSNQDIPGTKLLMSQLLGRGKSLLTPISRKSNTVSKADQWAETLNLDELQAIQLRQMKLLSLDKGISSVLQQTAKIHERISEAYLQVRAVDKDVAQASHRIHSLADNITSQKLLESQEEFWETRQSLDFLAS